MTSDELHKAFVDWYRDNESIQALLHQLREPFPVDRGVIARQIAELAFANGPGNVVDHPPALDGPEAAMAKEQRNLIQTLRESNNAMRDRMGALSAATNATAREVGRLYETMAQHERWLKELVDGE